MSEFTTVVLAFGRGIIKLLISGLTGFGVGLLVVGIMTAGRPDAWNRGSPPGELLIGIGAGLLSGGGTLLALFFVPFFLKRPAAPPAFVDEPPILARPAPRLLRPEHDEPPPRSKPHADPDDSIPIARPAPPRDEPGNAGFFEKG